jgi:hypothetical protein
MFLNKIDKYTVINIYICLKINPIRYYDNFQYVTITNKLKSIKFYLSFLVIKTLNADEGISYVFIPTS